MNTIYLLLGGNQGNTASILAMALQLLAQKAGTIVNLSPLYETEAWGKHDQPNFLNQAVQLDSPLNAAELLCCIQQIEKELGRQRNEHWGQRTLDIDILFFNDEIINTEHLSVPHPEIHNRKFALLPLCSIAENLVHPVFQLRIKELLDRCPDPLDVTLYKSAV